MFARALFTSATALIAKCSVYCGLPDKLKFPDVNYDKVMLTTTKYDKIHLRNTRVPRYILKINDERTNEHLLKRQSISSAAV